MRSESANRSVRTRIVFPVLLITGTLVTMLVGAEIVLRILGIGYAYSRVEPDPVLHHVHPPGFSYVRHDRSGEVENHRVAFDEEGRVVDPDGPAPRPAGEARYRVAFLGDSFVEALQVPYRESFVGRLEGWASEETRVANFGVSSYSPILYRLQWGREVAGFRPTHVVLLLYGNDVRNDEEYGRLARYDATGELVAVPGPRLTWWKRFARNSYVLRILRMMQMRWEHRGEGGEAEVGGHVEENPELSPETIAHLDALREEIEASGATLIVMAVPSRYALRNGSLPEGAPEFSDSVEAWARGAGVRYVDLAAAFRRARSRMPLFLEQDIHFNRTGNEVVAETVSEALPELFPLPPSVP